MTATNSTCGDCGAQPNQPHDSNCDVARCLATGGQRLQCDGRDEDAPALRGQPVSTDLAQVRIDGLAAGLAEERAERRASWLWECGCLINDGDAHRVGCPVYPEGRAARWG
jgi:hypothetical protein